MEMKVMEECLQWIGVLTLFSLCFVFIFFHLFRTSYMRFQANGKTLHKWLIGGGL